MPSLSRSFCGSCTTAVNWNRCYRGWVEICHKAIIKLGFSTWVILFLITYSKQQTGQETSRKIFAEKIVSSPPNLWYALYEKCNFASSFRHSIFKGKKSQARVRQDNSCSLWFHFDQFWKVLISEWYSQHNFSTSKLRSGLCAKLLQIHVPTGKQRI